MSAGATENARMEKAGPDYRPRTARLENAIYTSMLCAENAELNCMERRKCKNEDNRTVNNNYT